MYQDIAGADSQIRPQNSQSKLPNLQHSRRTTDTRVSRGPKRACVGGVAHALLAEQVGEQETPFEHVKQCRRASRGQIHAFQPRIRNSPRVKPEMASWPRRRTSKAGHCHRPRRPRPSLLREKETTPRHPRKQPRLPTLCQKSLPATGRQISLENRERQRPNGARSGEHLENSLETL